MLLLSGLASHHLPSALGTSAAKVDHVLLAILSPIFLLYVWLAGHRNPPL